MIYLFAAVLGVIIGFLIATAGFIEAIETHAESRQPILLKSGSYRIEKED